MTSDDMTRLVEAVGRVSEAAVAEFDGLVLAESESFDADVPCAVAALCHAHVAEVGQLLAGGRPLEWSVAADEVNVYVFERSSQLVVAVGDACDKPAKVAREIALQLSLSSD